MVSEGTLLTNLAAIERAQGHRPVLHPPDPARTRAVARPDGSWDLEIATSNDGWTPADPHHVAKALLERVRAADQIILVGGGIGRLLDMLETSGRHARLVVLEPDPGIALAMLARRDWHGWIAGGRLRVFTGPDYAGASACGRFFDGTRPVQVVVHDVLAVHRAEQAARAAALAHRLAGEARANGEARRRLAGLYLLQTIENLPTIQTEADADALAGRFTGQPAIIAAAGPSLDRALPQLPSTTRRAVTIACDTALRPLLAAGVHPHIVAGVDPSETNARHLADTPPPHDVWLVAEGSLHPKAFARFSGRTFTFVVSNHEPWGWLRELGLVRGPLRAWGSVLTSAFDLALRMGCDPIVFVGADLACSEGRPYCRGTIFEEEWSRWVAAGATWDEVWRAVLDARAPCRSPISPATPCGRRRRSSRSATGSSSRPPPPVAAASSTPPAPAFFKAAASDSGP